MLIYIGKYTQCSYANDTIFQQNTWYILLLYVRSEKKITDIWQIEALIPTNY